MKNIFVAATLLVLYSCNGKLPVNSNEPTAPAPKETNYSVGMLSEKTDYVCGMEMHDGGIADTAHYEGKVYGFCHEDCKKEFLKAPQQYLSAVK